MKTAGTALSHHVRQHYPPELCYPRRDVENPAMFKVDINGMLEHVGNSAERPQFFSMHMPSWVADEVAPDHLHIALLREPLRRTVSHLKHLARGLEEDDLVGIYEEPAFRNRLANYQTRILGLTRQDHEQRQKEIMEEFLSRKDSPEMSDEEQVQAERVAKAIAYTAMPQSRDMTEDDLVAARDRVDRLHLVGLTEELPRFADSLSRLLGLELGKVPQRNVAPVSKDIPGELLARIEQDCALDIALYEYAREKAG